MDQQSVNQWFQRLERLLEQKLPCEDGSERLVPVDEFMLMHVADNQAGFKHGNTRNYVFVTVDETGKATLEVPKKTDPFMQGYFDAYPSIP